MNENNITAHNISTNNDINVSLTEILNWCGRNGVIPLPCKPQSKIPINAITSRGVYGDNAPPGDSYHRPTPERLSTIHDFWANPTTRTLDETGMSMSVDMDYPTADGYTVACVDVDDWEYCDLMDDETFANCEVFSGKKGIKIFFKLDGEDRPREETRKIIGFYKRKAVSPAIELFTGNKHALIYGEHEASTPDNPIYYRPLRGLVDLPVIKLSEMGAALDRYTQSKSLSIRETDNTQCGGSTPRAERTADSITISEQYDLRCEQFLMPEKPTIQGNKIVGIHPIHGSTTKHNLEIDTASNTWICRRCNRGVGDGGGGGPIEALAVAEGIIQCHEAKSGCFTKEHWSKIFKVLEQRGIITHDSPHGEDGSIKNTFGVYNNNGDIQRPNYPTIGDHLIKKWHCLVYMGEIYIYDPIQKIYRQNQSDLEGDIISICVDQLNWNKTIIEPQRQILSYIANKSEIIHHEYPFNRPEDGFSLRNGVIKITDGHYRFEESSPEHMFTYRLNVQYNPSADREPTRQMLRSLANGNEKTLAALYEIPAQAMLQMQRLVFKRAYLLVGPPHAGKSTLIDLYKKTFGFGNVSSIQLQNLDDRWSAYTMENKIINVYDDLSPLKMSDTTSFKTFTGTAFHQVEQKYKDAHFGLVNPVHIFSANTPPFVPSHASDDDGFWCRWGLIEFAKVFAKDPSFNNTLLTDENISGFFNDVIDTTVKIVANNYNLTLTDDSEYVRDRWLYLSNDLYRFIHDNTEVKPNVEIHAMATLSNLYERYIEYLISKRRGGRFTLPTQESFGIKLSQEFGMVLTQHRVTYPSGVTERKRVYYGIVLKQ